MAPNNPLPVTNAPVAISRTQANILQGLAKLGESKLTPNEILNRAYLARRVFQEEQQARLDAIEAGRRPEGGVL